MLLYCKRRLKDRAIFFARSERTKNIGTDQYFWNIHEETDCSLKLCYLIIFFNSNLSLIYTVNYFYVFPVHIKKICYICSKYATVPEEDWFGQPKYRYTFTKIILYAVSVFAFIFSILYMKPIRSLLF